MFLDPDRVVDSPKRKSKIGGGVEKTPLSPISCSKFGALGILSLAYVSGNGQSEEAGAASGSCCYTT